MLAQAACVWKSVAMKTNLIWNRGSTETSRKAVSVMTEGPMAAYRDWETSKTCGTARKSWRSLCRSARRDTKPTTCATMARWCATGNAKSGNRSPPSRNTSRLYESRSAKISGEHRRERRQGWHWKIEGAHEGASASRRKSEMVESTSGKDALR